MPTPTSGTPPASEIYRAYNHAENQHDLDQTTVLLSTRLSVTVNGRAAVASADEDRVAMAELLRLYPDYRRELDEVIPIADDRAVVRWRMLGTPSQSGFPVLDVPGCSIVRSHDGRLVEAHLYYDGKPLDEALRAVSHS